MVTAKTTVVKTTVMAKDGAEFAVESTGAGPGIVVVHGGGVRAKDYRRFAHGLADRFTVHLYSRRGRPGGADLPASGYTVQVDIDDLAMVLAETGARMVFGHSIGGFIALRAAMQLPIDRLALYDPAVAVDDDFPMSYLDDFEAAVKTGDYALAVAVVGRGLRSAGALSDLPMGFQMFFAKLFLRTPIGKEWLETLHTVPAEAGQARAHQGPASRYRDVKAAVLLAAGRWSPAYYVPVGEKLAAAMPNARFIRVPKARHDGPNIARPAFLKPFADFFGAA